ncbi:MAG: nucleotidyltransferase domain-containing protein [Bacillota bacterium]
MYFDEKKIKIDISNFSERLGQVEQRLEKYSASLITVYLFGSMVSGKNGPLSDTCSMC